MIGPIAGIVFLCMIGLTSIALATPQYYTFTTVEYIGSENINYTYTEPIKYIVEIDFDLGAYYIWDDGHQFYWPDSTAVFSGMTSVSDYFYVDLLTSQLLTLDEDFYTENYVADIHKGRTALEYDTDPNDGMERHGGFVELNFGSVNDFVIIEQRSEWYDFVVNNQTYRYYDYDMSIGAMFHISDYAYDTNGNRQGVLLWAELTDISDSNPLEAQPVPEPSTMLLLGSGLLGLVGFRKKFKKA